MKFKEMIKKLEEEHKKAKLESTKYQIEMILYDLLGTAKVLLNNEVEGLK